MQFWPLNPGTTVQSLSSPVPSVFKGQVPQSSALSPVPSAQYPQSSALSPVPSVQYPQPSALSPVPSVQHPEPSCHHTCRKKKNCPQPSALSPASRAVPPPYLQGEKKNCPQPSALSPVPSVQHPEPSRHHTCREKKKLPLQARILRKNGQSFALKKSPNSLAVGPGPHPT